MGLNSISKYLSVTSFPEEVSLSLFWKRFDADACMCCCDYNRISSSLFGYLSFCKALKRTNPEQHPSIHPSVNRSSHPAAKDTAYLLPTPLAPNSQLTTKRSNNSTAERSCASVSSPRANQCHSSSLFSFSSFSQLFS